VTSRERILSAIDGRSIDHVPLTTWCFGLRAPAHLRWGNAAGPVDFWYSKRMEHLHTLPRPWDIEDDFCRVEAWLGLGMDDVLDVSVPWSADPAVSFTDSTVPPGGDESCPVLVREYRTPAGPLRHAVRHTGETPGEGWVVQPDRVRLFEDYNIPRAQKHAVAGAEDVPKVAHLYRGPDAGARMWFADRMAQVKVFADGAGVAAQAWSAFGMDAAVWLCGAEGAVMLAMDAPEAFGRLIDIIHEADFARTQLATTTSGVDIVVQRGWYSSTDFWSVDLFERYVLPPLRKLTDLAHRHGRRFGYVMTTGVATLGQRLADAGVDVLYFVDPVQDRITLEQAGRLLGGRIALVGGTSALSLASRDRQRIENEVRRAVDVLGPTGRFILHPVDALFPDTPWEGVEAMIQAWKRWR
jgi:hypothetical protein